MFDRLQRMVLLDTNVVSELVIRACQNNAKPGFSSMAATDLSSPWSGLAIRRR